MTTYENAEAAIRHSIRYGEIAYCNDTPANHDTLLAQCDDRCRRGGLQDYWFDDTVSDHKMSWRVSIEVITPPTDAGRPGR